ncbi:MAG: response regulator transcription factor [Acetobacteraceae bacterium]
MRLLLVENDCGESVSALKTFHQGGFTVDHAGSGFDAIEMLQHYDYDLAIIDLSIDDLDGCDVIRRVRRARVETPIIVTSQGSSARDKIATFNAGADDFIERPYDDEELIARLHAVARRSRGFSTAVITLGNLTIDLNAKSAFASGVSIPLTGKEYAILELLVLRRGTILTKDAFLNHLYGGRDEPEMKIIDVFICKLRRKLQEHGIGNLIGTVWGRGYVLMEEFQPVSRVINPQPSSLINA